MGVHGQQAEGGHGDSLPYVPTPFSRDQLSPEMQHRYGLDRRPVDAARADRAEAIRASLKDMGPDDALVIAGKGHESYQEIAGVRQAFSDEAQARHALRQRRAA
mgnify:CR=1 FL=1